MSAVEQPVLTKEEQQEFVKQGGLAAFRDVGATKYQRDEEEVDAQAIADGIYPLVLRHRVDALDARDDDALIEGDLTKKYMPNLIGPDDEEWAESGDVIQGIWFWCQRKVWNQTNPNVGGKVQAKVRQKHLTLCRTKVSRNNTLIDAVYVTADLECIKIDFGLPLKASVRNAASNLAKNMAETIETHPEFKTQLAKEVEAGMKAATQLAKATLALSAGESEEE
jgi:hypothetical protein